MDADQNTLTLENLPGLADEFASARNERRPGFLIALMCAALAHAAFIGWIGRAPPRYVGGPGGSTQAINVEIVDAADLLERGSGSDGAQAGAAEAVPKGAQVEQKPVTEPTPAPDPTPPDAPAADAQPNVPEPAEAPPAQKQAAVPAPSVDASEMSLPDDVLNPGESSKTPKEESKPQPQAKKSKPAQEKKLTAPPQLDLSVPLGMAMRESANVGSSSATRPAGITRSAENDRFGRDVIRALRRTMPPQGEAVGRVTVRIFLNERGNISKLQLVQTSADSILTQDVMFTVRQTAFPFPPKGASVADRTFLITYIYR